MEEITSVSDNSSYNIVVLLLVVYRWIMISPTDAPEKENITPRHKKALPVKILPAREQQTLIQGHSGPALDGGMP